MGIVTQTVFDKAMAVAKEIESGKILSELDKLSGRKRRVRPTHTDDDEDIEPDETDDLFDDDEEDNGDSEEFEEVNDDD